MLNRSLLALSVALSAAWVGSGALAGCAFLDDAPGVTPTNEGEGEGAQSEGEGDVGEGEEGEGDAGEEGEGEEGEGEEGEGEEGEGEEGEGEGEGDVVVEGDITVLLIGNSQLGFFGNSPQPPDVTEALEQISTVAYAGASHLIVDKAQIDGTGCDGWASAGDGPGTPKERAGSGEYDIVIMAPAIGERAAQSACWELFRDLAENAGSQFGVMASAHVSFQYPRGFDDLDSAVRGYAATNDLLFVPGGEAWRRVLGDNPGNAMLEFYGGDDAHPGAEGSYFYVLALYGAITGRSVVGLPVDSPPLRCFPNQPCMTYERLDECIDDATGTYGGTQPPFCGAENGALFDGNNQATFISAAEAAAYQQVVDDVLAER